MEKIIENTGTAQVHGQLTKFKVCPTKDLFKKYFISFGPKITFCEKPKKITILLFDWWEGADGGRKFITLYLIHIFFKYCF